MESTPSLLEEQLKKSERLPVGWPWRLLVFTTIVFGVTVATYFGMVLGYKPYLNSRVKNLDQEITGLSQAIDEQQQKSLVNFYSQLINIQDLLTSRQTASTFFDFLEKNTHQNVYYQSLNLSLPEKNVKIEGNASNYNVLVQQLELFRRAPEIERVLLDDSRLGEGGGIRFSIRFIFKPELMGFVQNLEP